MIMTKVSQISSKVADSKKEQVDFPGFSEDAKINLSFQRSAELGASTISKR